MVLYVMCSVTCRSSPDSMLGMLPWAVLLRTHCRRYTTQSNTDFFYTKQSHVHSAVYLHKTYLTCLLLPLCPLCPAHDSSAHAETGVLSPTDGATWGIRAHRQQKVRTPFRYFATCSSICTCICMFEPTYMYVCI